MPEHHTIFGSKVHVYKRPNGSLWRCSSYFAGENRRASTKEESLSKAKEIAEDWYLQLRGRLRGGEIKSEKTFREMSEHYLREFDIITPGQRNKRYVEGQHWRSKGPSSFFRESGHLRGHLRKDPGLPNSQTPRGYWQTWRTTSPSHAASGNRDAPPDLKKRRSADGSTAFPIFRSRDGNRPRYLIGRGSHQKNTNNSTKRHESVRRNRRNGGLHGKRNNSTTMCSLQSILDYGPTSRGDFGSAM
jgi:hypothetical protein